MIVYHKESVGQAYKVGKPAAAFKHPAGKGFRAENASRWQERPTVDACARHAARATWRKINVVAFLQPNRRCRRGYQESVLHLICNRRAIKTNCGEEAKIIHVPFYILPPSSLAPSRQRAIFFVLLMATVYQWLTFAAPRWLFPVPLPDAAVKGKIHESSY